MMSELETAYRATTYQVFLPGGICELRIDQPCQGLLNWLKDEEVDQFALITAFNPVSGLLEPAENLERQSRLEVELLEGGYEPFAGENVPDDPAAPREETCFIPDIPLVDALALAAQYGQNAIVHGGADGIPRLAWIRVAETWGKE